MQTNQNFSAQSEQSSLSVNQLFLQYVPQNILGMLGISIYILADTFFIAQAVGANGITALNLVLPVYSLIFAIGALIGTGGSIRFNLAKNRNANDTKLYFFNSLFWGTCIGLCFSVLGGVFPESVICALGGNQVIVQIGREYTRIFMIFAPAFIWNSVCNAFVRNDGEPKIAMAATLVGSLFNIVMDYVFMFPLRMGMPGAALATSLAPLVGVGICSIHILSKKSELSFSPEKISFQRLMRSCQLGISAFIGEISSGVITVSFNLIILKLAGNIGVAAYGIVANIALVASAIFNGLAQGVQPVISMFYAKNQQKEIKKLFRMGMSTAVLIAIMIIVCSYIWSDQIIMLFNKEGNSMLAQYAEEGIHIYFIGFLFAGMNVLGTVILSAVEVARGAFLASMSRGFVLILVFVIILSVIFKMSGVWWSFPLTELATLFITGYFLKKEIIK